MRPFFDHQFFMLTNGYPVFLVDSFEWHLVSLFANNTNIMNISVFLDGANFFFMQRDALGWWADPERILDYIGKSGKIVDAFYYIGQDIPPEARQKAYLDGLSNMGYTLQTKAIKIIYDQKSNTRKKKANLDVEIVLDMFNTIDHYDKAVLISGDGDFERPLKLLRDRGKQFEIIATDKFMAKDLRTLAGRHYIRFDDIRADVERN